MAWTLRWSLRCADGRPGGLTSANTWLRKWIPRILASPAYRQNGLLVITFDEADTADTNGADACCGEGPGPNSPLPGGYGLGGGRTGALLLSPHIAAGTWNDTAYNHYSLLRSIENIFALRPLGYAANARGFGYDCAPHHSRSADHARGASRALSTSPSSMRRPPILTWSSSRPRKTSPSPSKRTRSPLR